MAWDKNPHFLDRFHENDLLLHIFQVPVLNAAWIDLHEVVFRVVLCLLQGQLQVNCQVKFLLLEHLRKEFTIKAQACYSIMTCLIHLQQQMGWYCGASLRTFTTSSMLERVHWSLSLTKILQSQRVYTSLLELSWWDLPVSCCDTHRTRPELGDQE